jgi:hypothetical protein
MSNGLGATYGLAPMAFLTADADRIVLSGNLGTFEFTRSALRKIGRGGIYPWFFSSIRLHHNTAGFPEELQFKPLGARASDIRARLKALGYPAV